MPQIQDWEEIAHEIVYRKYSQTIERRDFRMPDGRIDDFYVRIERPGVCVLAMTTDNKVITLPQYRPGPKRILQEIPGGMMDATETPEETAVRELLEETGFAGEVDNWIGAWESDAYTEAHRHIVIVKNCTRVAEPQLEDNEFGEVELLSISDFVRLVRTGNLTDTAGAMLALDHLGLLK